jgi:hypothetical protein
MKSGFSIIAVVCSILVLTSCTSEQQNEDSQLLKIDQTTSWFDDFKVKDNMVYIYCYVTIENRTASDVEFHLIGDFKDDKENGLLMTRRISGTEFKIESTEVQSALNKEVTEMEETRILSADNVLFLNAGATESFNVVFIGEFGGVHEKMNRLLPDLEIKPVHAPGD